MILKPRPFRKPNPGHPLAKGLVGFWLMNEGGGNIVQDLSGNGNVGTISGAVWTPGKFGSCLDFDSAVADYITLRASNKLNLLDKNMTLCFWVKINSLMPDTSYLSNHSDGVERADITFRFGKFRWDLDNGPTADYLYLDNRNWRDNLWHHFVVVHNETEAKAYGYIDGVIGDNSPQTITATGSKDISGSRLIGYSSLSFYGVISYVMVYDRA